MQWPRLPAPPPDAIQPLARPHVKPFVCDDGSAQSLHFTMGKLQSRMNKASPWQRDSQARQQLKPEFARITWAMKDLDDSVYR